MHSNPFCMGEIAKYGVQHSRSRRNGAYPGGFNYCRASHRNGTRVRAGEYTAQPLPAISPVDIAADVPPEDDATTRQAADSDSTMQDLIDQHHNEPGVKKGEILEGTVVSTTPTEIMIDLGLKSEGVIQSKELERIGP